MLKERKESQFADKKLMKGQLKEQTENETEI